ncbi:hypothetical protein SUDANB95_03469 [Actinosynnema sp. ALI-1.44]
MWWDPLIGAFFALTASRAALLPGRDLRPKNVGLVEVGLSALLLVALAA